MPRLLSIRPLSRGRFGAGAGTVDVTVDVVVGVPVPGAGDSAGRRGFRRAGIGAETEGCWRAL
ncbi:MULTISPECIES: hypothetical protein [unclassified Cyanobium]|uniref:hypothetical protein n=1 Tax=unclassified Cyanobium TaxID=2627006 RepID=UPI0020CDC1EA|nr:MULTISPECIES: hypothetical protein [unclassified Cyanobium]MCP9899327.1 hypothetical protein [Cyanobium sp. Cruz CV11-17]